MNAAPADHRCGRGVGRIDRKSSAEQDDGLLHSLPGEFIELRDCAEVKIVCFEALRGLTRRPIDLRLTQFGLDRADDAARHLVLQLEDVVERTAETVGPDM